MSPLHPARLGGERENTAHSAPLIGAVASEAPPNTMPAGHDAAKQLSLPVTGPVSRGRPPEETQPPRAKCHLLGVTQTGSPEPCRPARQCYQTRSHLHDPTSASRWLQSEPTRRAKHWAPSTEDRSNHLKQPVPFTSSANRLSKEQLRDSQ